jgi:hypothetical protein
MKIIFKIKAFWRQKGYSGEVISDGSILEFEKNNLSQEKKKTPKLGPICVLFDATTINQEPALGLFLKL